MPPSFRRHKVWGNEGGISTPLIVHWPRGIAAAGQLRHTPGHVVDLLPTLLEPAGGNEKQDLAATDPRRVQEMADRWQRCEIEFREIADAGLPEK